MDGGIVAIIAGISGVFTVGATLFSDSIGPPLTPRLPMALSLDLVGPVCCSPS